MTAVFFTTVKGLIAHKLRLFATALAVTLGVAFMAGTLVLTDTVSKTFDDLFGDIYQADRRRRARPRPCSTPGLGSGTQRGRVDEACWPTPRSPVSRRPRAGSSATPG